MLVVVLGDLWVGLLGVAVVLWWQEPE